MEPDSCALMEFPTNVNPADARTRTKSKRSVSSFEDEFSTQGMSSEEGSRSSTFQKKHKPVTGVRFNNNGVVDDIGSPSSSSKVNKVFVKKSRMTPTASTYVYFIFF